MVSIQIQSIAEPLLSSPRVTALALGLVARAQVMGFLPRDIPENIQLDAQLLDRLGRELRSAGVATIPTARLHGARARELEKVLHETVSAIDASPHPQGEWTPAREVLGDELLARLVGGISPSSLRRYASGERETPDAVAWRLHLVARILASLLGSYNSYGIRRWFERRRSVLGGRTPAEVIASARDEDDLQLRQVLSLADALVGAGAAA